MLNKAHYGFIEKNSRMRNKMTNCNSCKNLLVEDDIVGKERISRIFICTKNMDISKAEFNQTCTKFDNGEPTIKSEVFY
jgi:acetyl-CoA carboxylase beta subunit